MTLKFEFELNEILAKHPMDPNKDINLICHDQDLGLYALKMIKNCI